MKLGLVALGGAHAPPVRLSWRCHFDDDDPRFRCSAPADPDPGGIAGPHRCERKKLMYAGHFAAALAIKGAAPRSPTAALVVLANLPDLFWLGFSLAGVELVTPGNWYDGWSHSVGSILVQSLIVGALCWRLGAAIAFACAGAVLSHLFLDLPMHPAPLEWFPHSQSGVGDFLKGWAGQPLALGRSNGWWFETAFIVICLTVYLIGSRRAGIGAAGAAASALLVLSLQLAFG